MGVVLLGKRRKSPYWSLRNRLLKNTAAWPKALPLTPQRLHLSEGKSELVEGQRRAVAAGATADPTPAATFSYCAAVRSSAPESEGRGSTNTGQPSSGRPAFRLLIPCNPRWRALSIGYLEPRRIDMPKCKVRYTTQ